MLAAHSDFPMHKRRAVGIIKRQSLLAADDGRDIDAGALRARVDGLMLKHDATIASQTV